VTGVNYLLETKNAKILLDCGLFQGSKDLEHKNSEPFSYDPKEIKAVIVSHSHLDHNLDLKGKYMPRRLRLILPV